MQWILLEQFLIDGTTYWDRKCAPSAALLVLCVVSNVVSVCGYSVCTGVPMTYL